MSMIGTFLVRSGILTSVHAFAVDPERGGFILALLAIYTSAAFLIFALRIGTVRQGAVFHLFSREGGLVINNILLSAILGIVLIGTLYPLIAEAFFDAKLSVGPPYFNKVTVPITLMLMVALAVGPLLRWRRDGRKGLGARLIVPLLVSLGTAALLLARGGIGWMPMAGLSLATGLGIASVMPLFGRNLRRARLTLYGMVVAHLGIAVSIAGMASESAFTQEKLAAVAEGETLAFGQWSVRLAAVEPVLGPNWTAVEGVLHVRRADGSTIVLRPQARSFFSPPTQTNEAALLTTWDGQLYAVLGGKGQATAGPAKWQLRLWWKPGVTLIWIGGVLVALGGLLALVGRLPMGWLRWRRREVVGYAR
jgi:cytochrome c-type biogenesis protein CcmF